MKTRNWVLLGLGAAALYFLSKSSNALTGASSAGNGSSSAGNGSSDMLSGTNAPGATNAQQPGNINYYLQSGGQGSSSAAQQLNTVKTATGNVTYGIYSSSASSLQNLLNSIGGSSANIQAAINSANLAVTHTSGTTQITNYNPNTPGAAQIFVTPVGATLTAVGNAAIAKGGLTSYQQQVAKIMGPAALAKIL